jgi:hypothetical protein
MGTSLFGVSLLPPPLFPLFSRLLSTRWLTLTCRTLGLTQRLDLGLETILSKEISGSDLIS